METNGISKQSYEVLEDQFTNYIGAEHAVACNTGTSALTLALAALDIGPGDEVIVPEFTMIATAWAVTYLGATPVFVDCGNDLNIDCNKIREKITHKTKAIMITHVYGRPVRETGLLSALGLPIIEDACEAHGAELRFAYGEERWGKKIGTFGTLTCFSFYKNKIVHGEEGGMVTTEYHDLAEKIRDLRSMAFGKNHNYLHHSIGFNFRMTNSQAQMISHSLMNVEVELARRETNRQYLDIHLGHLTIPRPRGSVMWVYDMVFANPQQKTSVFLALERQGVAVRHFFKPMSMQPMYNGHYQKLKAFDFANRGLYVPIDQTNRNELDLIIKTVKENL